MIPISFLNFYFLHTVFDGVVIEYCGSIMDTHVYAVQVAGKDQQQLPSIMMRLHIMEVNKYTEHVLAYLLLTFFN